MRLNTSGRTVGFALLGGGGGWGGGFLPPRRRHQDPRTGTGRGGDRPRAIAPPLPRWPGREEVCCSSTRWCPHALRGRRKMRESVPGRPPPPSRAGVIGGLLPPNPSFGVTPTQHPPRFARLGVWRFRARRRQAPGQGKGVCPALWAGPRTGVALGGRSMVGPRMPGGPVPARRIAQPPPRVGPRGQAPGEPARPGAGLWGSLNPLRSPRGLRGQLGSSG